MPMTENLTETVHHAEVVGSLQRPAQLIQARTEFRSGTLAPQDYQRIEDAAVDEALALQEESGLQVLTDGEMRRDNFVDFFISGMTGLSMEPAATMTFHRKDGEDRKFVFPFSVTGPVKALECPGVAEFSYASQRTDRLLKVTLPSPMLALSFYGPASRDAYPDPFDFAADAASAVQQWMRQLAAAGCRYIQIDAPEMATVYVDHSVRAQYEANGISTDRFLSMGTELLTALGSLDLPGVRKGIHVCRGNDTQGWLAEGGYGQFTKQVFRRLDGFDVFHMEYDDERSGDFAPLKHLPDDKVAALGMVSTKWSVLEDEDELVARIEDAARFHPKEQLAIAPQCGFASEAVTAEDRRVLPTTQRDKLRLVASVAERVWGA
ncbi:cobalamin-independent methionine synthase II family protein [Mycobacterium deserti]|uniref:Cobalamin-independent methionine synthase II family protein n=1 Tax=Mycobacterium deserti TaxID=2978347 RepID=A0ABT2MEI7_9MYCO|nr:cobalamin-independent methionine synthase II family protein [Mycobacterium deserti]MCT7660678.1 cobalamin-independent methionine synthase II family protein [Mycobacterium deserti]